MTSPIRSGPCPTMAQQHLPGRGRRESTSCGTPHLALYLNRESEYPSPAAQSAAGAPDGTNQRTHTPDLSGGRDMTPQDNWRPEMARLAQRQDQLERQHRDSNRNVEALRRDADAMKRDVDRRMDSLRGEMDSQSWNRDWRVSSLERSRDTFENLFWFSMLLVAAVAVVITATLSRGQRQESGEPEQSSPSFINASIASSGCPLQPGFVAAGLPFRQRHRHPGNHDWRSRELLWFNPSTSEGRPPTESRPYRIVRVTPQFATCFMTGPADPAWSSRYLRPGDEVKGGDRQP